MGSRRPAYEHRFAKPLLVLLMAGGVALAAKPMYDLSRIRDMENPGLPRRFLHTGHL